MTVKEANKYIKNIDREMENLQKLLTLSEAEQGTIEESVDISTSIIGMVNTAVNCMCSYKYILKEKIDNARLD